MPKIPSYRYYEPQRYEESDFSGSEPSNRQPQPLNIQKPVGRPGITSYQSRLAPRPLSRRSRPMNNLSYGQIPAASRTHPDVKEIYRRKSLQQSVQDDFADDDYDNIDQNFYKNPILYTQQSFYSASPPKPLNHPQENCINPMANNTVTQVSFDINEYKNIPHIPCNRNSLTRIPSGTGMNAVKANPKRFPVSAKAPRFFKKTSSATACKVPSNNCTPPIIQYNTDVPKDSETERKDGHLLARTRDKALLERHHSFPVNRNDNITRPLTAPSNDNASVRSNRIESVLKRYEEMVHVMGSNHKIKSFETPTKENNQNMPASPRKPQITNQEHGQIQQEKKSPRSVSSPISSTPNNDSAPTVLQTMLQELMQKGCVNKIPKNSLTTETNSTLTVAKNIDEENKKFSSGIIGDSITIDESKIPKSINYQEMQDSMKKTSVVFQMGEPGTNDTTKEIQVPSSSHHRVSPPSIVTPQTNPLSHNTKLNENYSMELHRSKSYIVNLIDRALSKELGTVPDDRINCYNASSKGQCNNNQKNLMEMIEKHAKKTEPKDFSLDLSNAFSDSRTTNEDINPLEIKEDCMCPCSSSHGEQPNYIKQLKQLRWGHLKHIQREVRRLADLERFLDSCNYE